MKKNDKRYRLFGRPGRPSSWWPREGRLYAYVGIMRDGGWVVGDGDVLSQEEVRVAKQVMGWDWKAPKWRVERVPDVEGFAVSLSAGAATTRVLCVARDAETASRYAREQAHAGQVHWIGKPDRRRLRVTDVVRHSGIEAAI